MSAAVRAVVLSGIQSVLSIARRRHDYLLVGSKKSTKDDQVTIFQSFASLRARLLRSENLAEVAPGTVMRPFLDLIRHEHTSSTLTGAALEVVQNFLMTWPWASMKDPHVVADCASDVVDAVSQCRFIETNADSDLNVLVMVVHVLHGMVTSPCAPLLSDHSMWQLVESLYALSRAGRNDPHIPLSLRTTASNFLHIAIAFIFSSPSVYADAANTSLSTGFGLPCAVKIMGFLCQKLHQRSAGSPGTTSSLGSYPVSASRREVLLSFSLLQCALRTCDPQEITRVPSLMLFIKDDLCSAILRYCRLGACADQRIPVLCLELIRLLWSKLRFVLKMQLEAIINGVFGHTLHWTISNLDVLNPDFPGGNIVINQTSTPNAQTTADGKPVAVVDAAIEEFSGEMISRSRLHAISFEIMDCLVDLLSESTLLPDLYVNYDCDGNRSDLTQNLFDLLSQVVQQSHTACNESHEEGHYHWAQAMGESALRGLFNALYVVYLRTEQHQPKLELEGAGSSGVSSEDERNVDRLLDENDPSADTIAAYVNAEALHKKRQRKKFFQHGIQEFNRKPLAGIKYLQQHTFLPTPLDTKALASFLRSLPQGLNKNAVGVYLGAMGKEVKDFEKTEIHEADTIEFHRDVLTNFVRSFNFEGESIVTALRMFLASFRLPGEAQQIDRILNTFSLQVYEQCRERFLMASVDVAYLLSFSLIMLNTDLHNSNIRPEKKMKLEDFIKNNKNYGKEVSKDRDLPDDYLTELYNTIAKDEIKTFEDGGKNGEVTTDRWKDLLIQAESDPKKSLLIVHHSYHNVFSSRTDSTQSIQSKHRSRSGTSKTKPTTKSFGLVDSMNQKDAMSNDDDHLTDDKTDDGKISEYFPQTGFAGDIYDRYIFELVQQNLLRGFSSVFQRFVEASNTRDASYNNGANSSSADAVVDQTVYYKPEKSMLQLACNGFVLCAAVASHLGLTERFNLIFVRICKYTALFGSDIYPRGYNGRENGASLFCNNQSTPLATAAVLKLVGTCSLSLRSDSWKYFFHIVSALREFQALPARLLHPSGAESGHMTREECIELVDLVLQNKAELERKIALSARGHDTDATNSGGFFSGVAWLFSALDSSLGGAVMDVPSTTSGQSLYSEATLSLEYENGLDFSPADLAESAEDLVVELKSSADHSMKNTNSPTQWIRKTLEPYRLEYLINDISSLPSRALSEVMAALHEEILQSLHGTEKKSTSEGTNSGSTRRVNATAQKRSVKRLLLHQGGCVLFEHLLTQIIVSSVASFDGEGDDDDGISKLLEAHYTQLLDALRPVLLTNESPSGFAYENACFLLQKALNGLFAWAMKAPVGANTLLFFVGYLMDINGDDELIRPFLAQIMRGFNRYVKAIQTSKLHYNRGDWLTVCNLISWSVESQHASSHAFALLEELVTGEIWNVQGNEITISDCYTQMFRFALKARSPNDKWVPRRPTDLLFFMFCTLRKDAPNYSDERLKFLGGMLVVARQLILRLQELPQQEQQAANEHLVVVLELVKQMVSSLNNATASTLSGESWFQILQYGLLPMAQGLLTGKASSLGFTDSSTRQNAAENNTSPFLVYERQYIQSGKRKPAQTKDVQQHEHKRSTAPRRRRPSVVKDPFALHPHVMTAQLISLVICEQLTGLASMDKFESVWVETMDLLVGLLDLTDMDRGRKANGGDAMIAALERRSVSSAHEEILEHVKGIVRRLTVLQDEEHSAQQNEEEKKATSEESAPVVVPHHHHHQALVHILVEKCQLRPGLFAQLFPATEDASSLEGEPVPPMDEGEDTELMNEEEQVES